MEIGLDTDIREIVKLYPDVAVFLESIGINCWDCIASYHATIEKAAKMHNLSSDYLIDKITSLIS